MYTLTVTHGRVRNRREHSLPRPTCCSRVLPDGRIIFGNSYYIANFKFDNLSVVNNVLRYNNTRALPFIDVRERGINYKESGNVAYPVSADMMPPSVPTALASTYVSSSEIRLAWSPSFDNDAMDKYRIYRDGVPVGFRTQTAYSDNTVLPGVSYTYSVSSIDIAGLESNQSFLLAVKTNAAPATTSIPTPPSGTTATGATLSASPTSISSGGTITAFWSNLPTPSATDWFGLYKPGVSKKNYLDRIYVSCSGTPAIPRSYGSCSLRLPASLQSGAYQLRLFANGGKTVLAVGNTFDVVKVSKHSR
jgi:chitodextrinase